jgi:ADP-heptose:LPS heptosyltransferase
VAITGGPDERALALAVAGAAGVEPGAVLAGRTDLEALAACVAAAARLVSGDTGIAHLATALGTPSVVLFGPTPPAEWGPPPGSPHVALWAGRRGDPHGDVPDPGLLEIGVPDVLAALDGSTGVSFPRDRRTATAAG